MTLTVQEGPVILIGYEYRLQLEAEADLFPESASFVGQVRSAITVATVMAELSSAAGSVLRVDDHTLEIVLAPEVTANLAPGMVVLDLVRTDLTPDRHLGFMLEVPVALPVTRLSVPAGQ
jgi:ABC-type arginine transport system ATPase subunit